MCALFVFSSCKLHEILHWLRLHLMCVRFSLALLICFYCISLSRHFIYYFYHFAAHFACRLRRQRRQKQRRQYRQRWPKKMEISVVDWKSCRSMHRHCRPFCSPTKPSLLCNSFVFDRFHGNLNRASSEMVRFLSLETLNSHRQCRFVCVSPKTLRPPHQTASRKMIESPSSLWTDPMTDPRIVLLWIVADISWLRFRPL